MPSHFDRRDNRLFGHSMGAFGHRLRLELGRVRIVLGLVFIGGALVSHFLLKPHVKLLLPLLVFAECVLETRAAVFCALRQLWQIALQLHSHLHDFVDMFVIGLVRNNYGTKSRQVIRVFRNFVIALEGPLGNFLLLFLQLVHPLRIGLFHQRLELLPHLAKRLFRLHRRLLIARPRLLYFPHLQFFVEQLLIFGRALDDQVISLLTARTKQFRVDGVE